MDEHACLVRRLNHSQENDWLLSMEGQPLLRKESEMQTGPSELSDELLREVKWP